MKKTRDQQQAMIEGMRLIADLLIPQVTPRVPSHIRDRARAIISDYPSEQELQQMIERAQSRNKPQGGSK